LILILRLGLRPVSAGRRGLKTCSVPVSCFPLEIQRRIAKSVVSKSVGVPYRCAVISLVRGRAGYYSWRREISFSMRAATLSVTMVFAVLLAPMGGAQTTATTDPVGVVTTVSCLSNSDTFVSLPFTRAPEFVGAIASAAGNKINISGSTGWSTNQFVYNGTTQHNHYYALIGTGGAGKEGHFYNITGNNATALTVDTSTHSLTGVPANAQVLVIPHWTLATIFPAADANVSFTPTTSVPTYKTQILPNYVFAGSNLPASPTYYFDGNTSKWRRVGDNGQDYGDDVVNPNSYFVVRNANSAPTLPFNPAGSVLMKKFATPLVSSSSSTKDNAAAMIRPVDVTLSNCGLNPADGSFVATPAPRTIQNVPRTQFKDQLFLFDNTQVAMNKTPSAVYYYLAAPGKGASWKLAGDGLTNHNNDMIPAGTALVIRKAKAATNQTVFWVNAPNY
jgi:uncharacterized protein (TIGR02597 family)